MSVQKLILYRVISAEITKFIVLDIFCVTAAAAAITTSII